MNRNRRHLLSAGLAGGLAQAFAVHASESFPARPLRLVVPYGAGGPADIVSRLVAQRMSELLGQQIVVVNTPGAGGNLGTATVARAAADGYTLVVGTSNTLAANPSLFERLPFDPVNDFAPVGMMFHGASSLSVSANVPARSVAELVELIRRAPREYSFASGGVGSSGHYSGELFKKLAGVDMTHVPYKGDSAAANDVVAGQVPVLFANISNAMKFHEAGKLRVLGVSTARRVPAFPAIPAIAESLPGFDLSSWYCLMAPARTPAAVIARLNDALVKTMNDEAIAGRIVAMGNIPGASTPQQVRDLIASDTPKWGALTRQANIRLE